jgi:glycosyltransferase involved in cell wall biosynthesis
MRLCIFAEANSIHSYRWVDFFARRGHEVHWISLTAFSDNIKCRATMHKIGSDALASIRPLNVLYAVKKLKQLITKIRPDVLHVHYAGMDGLIGALSRFHPLIITAWGSDVLIAGRSRLTKPLVKLSLCNADLVTCDAEHMRHAMMRLGVPEHKIKIIYFGTDTTRFCPAPKSKKLRKQLGVSDRPMIISLRSLEPVYDLETLLQSVPYVIKYFPDVVFIIAGGGCQENYLKSLANTLNIDDHVIFTGPIPNQQLPEYLTSSDIYTSTSLSDAGLAASTSEAMACALPVVVTDSAENKLWVKEGASGFVVPVKDPVALADKFVYLLQNTDKLDKYGSFNREIIDRRNNYHIEMGKMESLYRGFVTTDG